MKSFLLPAICLLFVFSSCDKKSEFLSVNVVTATIDGADVNFSTVASAHYANIFPGQYAPTLVINGASATQGISITITSPTAITNTTYVSSDTGNIVPFCDIVYDQDLSNQQSNQQYITNNNVPNTTTVTITSITSTNVAGTFSGILINSIGGTPSKTITNGKFNLKIN